MAMFGLIVSGRLVSTSWEQASPTNVVAEIQVYLAMGNKGYLGASQLVQDADSVNHVVIFLTGAIPFPEGLAQTFVMVLLKLD